MQRRMGSLLVAVVLGVFAMSGALLAQGETETVSLKHKSYQKWKLVLPQEKWDTVGGELPIPHADGSGFAVKRDGNKLVVDRKGDGGMGVNVAGIAGFVRLVAKSKQGNPFMYSVRLRKEGAGWQWATSGAMVGKFNGLPITLVDQNNNGRYDDFGADALIVGKGKAAALLSKVISVKGDLFTVTPSADGSEMSFTPYEGETGEINIVKGFRARGRLEAAVISSTSGDYSFEVSKAKRGLVVPVGEYVLSSGLVSSGSEHAKVRAGKMKPIEVKAGEEAQLTWGAQVELDFDFTAAAGEVKVSPTTVKYFGTAGEEYYDWFPDAVSPKIVIASAKTGRKITEGRFGGC